MSKLEELIQRYCPDGVEYRPLWSLTAWDKKFNGIEGKSKQKRVIKYNYLLAADLKSYQVEGGTVKLLTTNISNLYTSEELAEGLASDGEVVAIPWGGNPVVQYYKGRFLTADNRIATSLDTTLLNNKFLYYCMLSQLKLIASFYRGSGIKHPDMAKVLDLEIPIPPLPVQEEIVRILDTFTELQAELQAELQKRLQQYNYYRDNLLTNFTPDKQVKEYSLGELGTFTRGNGLQKKDFTETGIGCIHYGQIYTRYGAFTEKTLTYVDDELASHLLQVEKGDLVIACTSENVEDICKCVAWLGEENICTGGHACVFRHKQNPKYISYFFQTEYFFNQKVKYTYGTKVKDIKPESLAKIKILLPSLEEQERIVSILDNLYTLTTDLSQGLPAEIEKRRQQYEFYRDKLLTFKRKES